MQIKKTLLTHLFFPHTNVTNFQIKNRTSSVDPHLAPTLPFNFSFLLLCLCLCRHKIQVADLSGHASMTQCVALTDPLLDGTYSIKNKDGPRNHASYIMTEHVGFK